MDIQASRVWDVKGVDFAILGDWDEEVIKVN